jgi:AcrR family transcriptional regulator
VSLLDHGGRRERIVNAALRQAVNGYDSVRIRDVADVAGVPASAVYHYFPSKDGLLLDCLHSWLNEFAVGLGVDIAGPTEPHQRLLHVIARLTEQLSVTPRLADTAARAYLHATGSASVNAELVRNKLIDIFGDALESDQPTRPDHNQQVAALLADVWIANLLALAQNRATPRDVRRRLEHAVLAIRKNADRQKHRPSVGETLSAQGA